MTSTRRQGNARGSARRAGGAPPGDERSLDEVDYTIVKALRDDARVSVSELASRVGISRASAYARVGRLQARGVITGFTVSVDAKQLGLGIAALITLSVDQPRWHSVHEELVLMPEVEWCAVTAGEFDALVLVRASDIEAIRDVVLERLHGIEGIRTTKTLFILDEAVPHRVVLP